MVVRDNRGFFRIFFTWRNSVLLWFNRRMFSFVFGCFDVLMLRKTLVVLMGVMMNDSLVELFDFYSF